MNNSLISLIDSSSCFFIYGAQTIAYGTYKSIEHFTRKKPLAFLVSQKDKNPNEIDGVPVTDSLDFDKSTLIIVAVTELLQKEIIDYLHANSFLNLFILSAHEEHLLMSAYYDSLGIFPCIKENGNDDSDFVLYEAHSHKDKPLTSSPALKYYEKSVHAGASLGDKIVADFDDNVGDNISSQNKQYCEMTVTYWVWKNRNHDWVGIEHYRRHLLVTPGMLTNDTDVIMPLPYMCYPNEMSQFRRFVNDNVVDSLFKALKYIHPNKYEDYRKILFGQYQYTYNMVCAKKKVFDAYCEWFFEITQYMETMADKVPEIKETRALSYVAEVLTNLYFMYHRKDLNIRHTEKAIYT